MPNRIVEKSPDPYPVSFAKGEAHFIYFAKVKFQTCRNQLSPLKGERGEDQLK
jgi:hypothetical protein